MSGPAPLDVEAQSDKEILDERHRLPGLGSSQIRNQLRAKCMEVSVNTVRRVIQDKGYRLPKVERRQHNERFEAIRPNHMWHLDFVRCVNRTTTFTLSLIDDHSRFVVGHGINEAERSEMVLDTFAEVVRRHGRPELVMHDKGGAFWSWCGISHFTALLAARQTEQARLNPVVRQLLAAAVSRLALGDPEGKLEDATARYPLSPVIDGIAIFEGNALPTRSRLASMAGICSASCATSPSSAKPS